MVRVVIVVVYLELNFPPSSGVDALGMIRMSILRQQVKTACVIVLVASGYWIAQPGWLSTPG